MRLYSNAGKTQFKLSNGRIISYLVHSEGEKYYSYGFYPTKPGSIRYAKRNFKAALKKHKARLYNPDGGYLDGRDMCQRSR